MSPPQFGPPPAGGPSGPRATSPYMGPGTQAPPNQGLQPPPYSGGFGQQPPPGYPYPAPGYGQGYSQTVTVVGPPTGFVYLSWVASPTADSYRIYRTLASAPANFSVSQTVRQPIGQIMSNALVTGLTPGAPYLLQVRVVNSNGVETVVPSAVQVGPGLSF